MPFVLPVARAKRRGSSFLSNLWVKGEIFYLKRRKPHRWIKSLIRVYGGYLLSHDLEYRCHQPWGTAIHSVWEELNTMAKPP
jgi:hypothetical protein